MEILAAKLSLFLTAILDIFALSLAVAVPFATAFAAPTIATAMAAADLATDAAGLGPVGRVPKRREHAADRA